MRRLALLAAGVTLAIATAHAQSSVTVWDYVSYKKDATGQTQRDINNAGRLELKDKGDGTGTVRLVVPTLDICHRGELPVTVVRTETTLTLTLSQPLSGCETFRYVIRNDGSGGRKEYLRGDKFVNDRYDHGLKPVQ